MKSLFLLLVIMTSINLSAQNDGDRRYAEDELKLALAKGKPRVEGPPQVILKDSTTAVSVAEPILFAEYGKVITMERPYKIFRLKQYYWVIMGTLPEDAMGGNFVIVLDARDCRVLRLTHYK